MFIVKKQIIFYGIFAFIIITFVILGIGIKYFLQIRHIENTADTFKFEMDIVNLIDKKSFCDNVEPIIYQKIDNKIFKKIDLAQPILVKPDVVVAPRLSVGIWKCPLKILPRFEYAVGFCPHGSCDAFIFPVEPNKEYYLAFRNLLFESKKIPIVITNFNQKKYEEFIFIQSSKEITFWFRDTFKISPAELTEILSLIQKFDGKLMYFNQSNSSFGVRFLDQEKLDLFETELKKRYEKFIILDYSRQITIRLRDKLENFPTEFAEIRSLIHKFDGKLIFFSQSESYFDVRFPNQEKRDLFKVELKKRNELMKVTTEF